MSDLDFFGAATSPVTLAMLAACAAADAPGTSGPERLFLRVSALECAGPPDVTVFDTGDDLADLSATRAGACFVPAAAAAHVPAGTVALVTARPAEALRRATALMHPASLRPEMWTPAAISSAAMVHPEARLEQGVSVDPFVLVGPRAEVGSGSTIGAGSVVGAGVRIGRNCRIGAHVSIESALIGDRVVIQSGTRIGTISPSAEGPGLGFVGRLGRVIIQNDVEIGANVVIDRGSLRDTVIGEGTRIGALVVIRAAASLGRHASVPDGFSLSSEMV